MSVKLANNAETSLSTAISAANTVIAVENGALFPTLGVDEWFPLTLEDSAGNREIVHVVGRTGNALTVNRAQEGTQPQDFAQGTHASLRLTAAVVEDLAAQIGANNDKFFPLSGGTLTGSIALKNGNKVFFIPEQGGQIFSIGHTAGVGLTIFVSQLGHTVLFKPDGDLQINGKFYCNGLYCGEAYLADDGNIWGTTWLDWDEDGWMKEAIDARIEERATEIAEQIVTQAINDLKADQSWINGMIIPAI